MAAFIRFSPILERHSLVTLSPTLNAPSIYPVHSNINAVTVPTNWISLNGTRRAVPYSFNSPRPHDRTRRSLTPRLFGPVVLENLFCLVDQMTDVTSDHVLLFSQIFRSINWRLVILVYALIFNCRIIVITGCVYLLLVNSCVPEITCILINGANFVYLAAFNALIGASVLHRQVTFACSFALLICCRRSLQFLPKLSPFRVPNWLEGTATIIIVSFAFLTFLVSQHSPTNLAILFRD